MKSSIIILVLTIFISCTFAHDKNLGRFLQITDTHLDMEYKEGSAASCWLGSTGLGCCRWYSIPEKPWERAGPYGSYNCDSPPQLLHLAFQWLQSQESSIDFVLWTGDSVNHHDADQTVGKNLANMQYSTQLFNQYLPNTQIYPSLGNHDTFPIDQLGPKPENDFVMDAITKLWGPWLENKEDNTTMNTIKYAGYYTLLIKEGYRLISLNSLYYDNHNILFGKQEPKTMQQMTWLNQTLYDARENNEKVWIIGHIYPGASEAASWFSNSFPNLFNDYNDIILHNFWGHSHRDQFILYNDKSGETTGMGFVAPSLMPDHQQSSLRFYYYDRDTMEILDFESYILNITAENPTYEYYYSAKDLYNMTDMSSQSWSNLYQKMLLNDDTLNTYWERYYPDYNSGSCDSDCQKELLCEIKYVNQTEYNDCL